jgi:electron transfer flavoprotein alpha subunit|tara:strand:- start:1044 stop:2018 length:975 start_codon:yes stop_codon:yes gene_type:complete
MSGILVLIDNCEPDATETINELLTQGRNLANQVNDTLEAVTFDPRYTDLAEGWSEHGLDLIRYLHNSALQDYGPQAWAQGIVQIASLIEPVAIIACGSDRGHEVMANVAAILDVPFAANCLSLTAGEPWQASRVQWGGSLIEEVSVETALPVVSFAQHSCEAKVWKASEPLEIVFHEVELDAAAIKTLVTERIEKPEGQSLETSAVVVSGGRGVGSADGFDVLEKLAELLNGKVGCSRAVTNNGWRSHNDQVGQTGKRIAPDLYIACGISGAIQHWVGAMASKTILAINTDPEANMVKKADYAVIANLHEVIPAVSHEIARRKN